MLTRFAVYLACFRDYRPYLQPGERGTAREGWLVCGRRAGKSFILALIVLARLIEGETAESVDLSIGTPASSALM